MAELLDHLQLGVCPTDADPAAALKSLAARHPDMVGTLSHPPVPPASPAAAVGPPQAAAAAAAPAAANAAAAPAESSGNPATCAGYYAHKRPRYSPPLDHRTCSNCGTPSTPFWRKDRDTGLSICNACGLYASKNDHPRPAKLWRQPNRPLNGPAGGGWASVPAPPAAGLGGGGGSWAAPPPPVQRAHALQQYSLPTRQAPQHHSFFSVPSIAAAPAPPAPEQLQQLAAALQLLAKAEAEAPAEVVQQLVAQARQAQVQAMAQRLEAHHHQQTLLQAQKDAAAPGQATTPGAEQPAGGAPPSTGSGSEATAEHGSEAAAQTAVPPV